jgi:hypothetical protein
MIRKGSTKPEQASCRLLFLAVWILLLAACASIPHPPVEAPPLVAPIPPPPEFTIEAGMLDTWNAAGQILVALDGVTYEGRAQMLGLYDVEYRGERFLILTRALVLTQERQVTTTRVSAVLQDGKPDPSDAARAVLDQLQARLPDELRLIAAGKVKAKGKTKKKR